MVNNYNDIVIGVNWCGQVYIAQGNPAIDQLVADHQPGGDLILSERLFYSQLRYRCVYIDPQTKRYEIGTPTEARRAEATVIFRVSPPDRMTGRPRYLGRL